MNDTEWKMSQLSFMFLKDKQHSIVRIDCEKIISIYISIACSPYFYLKIKYLGISEEQIFKYGSLKALLSDYKIILEFYGYSFLENSFLTEEERQLLDKEEAMENL